MNSAVDIIEIDLRTDPSPIIGRIIGAWRNFGDVRW